MAQWLVLIGLMFFASAATAEIIIAELHRWHMPDTPGRVHGQGPV